MVFGAFIILSLLIVLLLICDIELHVRKQDTFELTVTVFHHNITFKKRQRTTHQGSEKKKKKISYFKIFPKILKRLRKGELLISRITLPSTNQDFSVESFLGAYRIYAVLNASLSFISSNVKSLEISNDAISISKEESKFCLDITLKIKLFYLLLALSDYLLFSVRERIKNRRRSYVREQNG